MASSEADDLRGAVREFLKATSPSSRVRDLMTTEMGYDEVVWQQMAEQLGLHGIAVPDHYGGAGAGIRELSVVFEEMGAALLCSPFFSTVAMAIPAIVTSGDQQAMEDYLPSLADGTSTATLVLNERFDAWDPAAVTLTAQRDGGTFRVTGEAAVVLDGHTADLVLVAATSGSGISLLAIAADADGMKREPLATLDRTRKLARISFDNADARLIGEDGAAADGLARTYDLAVVALAAEQVGAAQRCLDMAVDYAKERIQFGRAIGSFQAVKHRCADMLVLVEGARSAAVHAAEAAEGIDLSIAASVAKMACSEAFLHIALDCMRIHGGIGFTWDHPAHVYFRRAASSQLLLGGPAVSHERLLERMGI